jgi:hypothetical protein
MKMPRKRAREQLQTFPRKAQAIALAHISSDRFPQHPSRPRSSLLAGLAAPGGFLLRASPILSLFAASLMAFAPLQASAQVYGADPQTSNSPGVRARARPDYDPMGVRVGGFDLFASVDLSATFTDNYFACSENAPPCADSTAAPPYDFRDQSETILAVSPEARLQSHWSRHSLVAEAGATFTNHSEFSGQDAESYYAGLRGRLDVGANSSISADARLSHLVEPRTDPDATVGGDAVEYDRTELAIGAQHTFNRFRLSARAGHIENNYDNAQSFRDFEDTFFTGRVDAEITPRLGVLLQATTDQRDYDNTPALNSDGQTYLVGATINLTDLMRGEIAVGQFNRDYDSGVSTEGTAVAANLEWYITRLTTLSFSAHRNTEDVVGATTATPYVETEYGARADHELLRNVLLTAGASAGRREYEVIDRDDDYWHADLGADWLINRRVVVGARYNHDEVESDGVNRYRDYEVNSVTVGVTLRL